MLAGAFETYAVTAAAMISAGAASYVSVQARRIVQRIEEAEERSRRNARLLTGETEEGDQLHYDGVLDRLEEVEARRPGGTD